MKLYEVVNYYSDDSDGIEARESLGLWIDQRKAEGQLWELGNILGIPIEDGQLTFECTPKGGLESDYYTVEERETND